MYAREHIYGIDGRVVVALSSLRNRGQPDRELARHASEATSLEIVKPALRAPTYKPKVIFFSPRREGDEERASRCRGSDSFYRLLPRVIVTHVNASERTAR